MQIVIKSSGVFISLDDDAFDYGSFGRPQIRRASHVEPDASGRWFADLSPVDGPTLGPFSTRTEALDAEIECLNQLLAEAELDEIL